jgi:hypothetical protein
MTSIKAELVELRKQSFRNHEKVLQAKECCCFDCAKFFASTEVVDWLDDDDQKTAMCPHCGFDTVVPIDPNDPISEDLLKEMQAANIGDGDESVVYPDFASAFKALKQSK